MKKRNKQFIKNKEYISLLKRRDELYDQRWSSYIILDKPYIYGYNVILDLREDIKRRDDAEIFYKILSLCTVSTFVKSKKDYYKKFKKTNIYYHSRAHLRDISEIEYLKLKPAVQKHFVKERFPKNIWCGYKYYCTLPNFYFVEKYVKNFIYKERIVLPEVEKELDEINALLNNKYITLFNRESNAPKKYTRLVNRAERRNNKIITKHIAKITNNFIYEEYSDFYDELLNYETKYENTFSVDYYY